MHKARLRAAIIDSSQFALLIGVDYLFLHFPKTHVPLVSRYASLLIVAAANGVMITYLTLARVVPRWRARRVADTWSFEERNRFRGRQ